MLENSWPHTWTISQFGSLTTLFTKQNRMLSFGQIFEPAQWIRVWQNYWQSHQKITYCSLFSSKVFIFMEVNQEKKNLSDILDKKCTFELVVSVQVFSIWVCVSVKTSAGPQAYRTGCRKAIIRGLMILIRVIYFLCNCPLNKKGRWTWKNCKTHAQIADSSCCLEGKQVVREC